MPKKAKKVFISSTAREFAAERQAIESALTAIGVKAILFDKAGPNTQDPWTFDQRLIADCDIFIGVYGEEYGGKPKGKRTSWIENEYKCAASHQKIILPYIKRVDSRDPRLDGFLRRHILSNHTAAYFGDLPDLVKQATKDVAALL